MPVKPRSQMPDFKDYIQIDLSEDDYAKLDASTVSPEELFLFLHGLCRDGYRLTFTADKEAKTVRATVMDIENTRSSAGYMLSAESDTFFNAALVVMYKHVSRMGSDWRPFCNQTRQIKRYR